MPRALRDLRLLPAAVAVWTLTATLPVASPSVLIAMGLLGVLLAGLGLALLARRGVLAGQLVILGVVTGLAALAVTAHAPPDPGTEEQEHRVKVIEAPRQHGEGQRITVWAEIRGERPLSRLPVTLAADADVLGELPQPGQEWRVRARLEPGGHRPLLLVSEVSAPPAPPGWGARARTAIRDDLRQRAARAPGPGASLLPGLVLGDTADQDEELGAAMKTVSMTHLTAVSGSNLAIVTGAVWLLLGLLGLPRRLRIAGAVLGLIAFAWLVGGEPSVLRAAAMALAVLLAVDRGSGRPGASLLLGAIVVVLLARPDLAGSFAFILSVAACCGIVLLALPMAERRPARCPRELALAVTVPLGAQLACTPVLIVLAPELSAWAVIANIAASPAVAPATILGMIGVVAELIGLAPVAAGSVWLAVLAAGWIAGCALFFAAAPLASLVWPAGVLGVIAASILVLLSSVALLALRRSRVLGVSAGACALLFLVVVLHRGQEPDWLPAGWAVLLCDVGQGSATVLATGEGSAVVVDVGAEPELIDHCLSDAGIEHLDLYLSHFDDDHIGGLSGALRGRQVGQAVTGPAPGPRAASRGVADALGEQGVVPEVGLAGEPWAHGEVAVQILWPRRSPADPPESIFDPGEETTGTESNELSLVLRAEMPGLRILIPGDIGAVEQARVATAEDLRVDLLIAPHHGSGDLDPDFYADAGARWGAVSVGENGYGHPHPDALAAFAGIPVLRTDECGSIALAGGEVSGESDVVLVTQRPCWP